MIVLLMVSLIVHAVLLRRAADRGIAEIIIHRLTAPAEAIISAPPDQRAAIADRLSGADLKVRWGRTSAVAPASFIDINIKHTGQMRQIMREIRTAPGEINTTHSTVRAVTVSALLDDGSWLNAEILAVSLLGADGIAFRAAVIAVAIALLFGAAVASRALAAPLVQLRNAVRKLPSEGEVALPKVDGPREVRELAEAFETSAQHVRDLLRQRSLALGALSHDLMSPLARLKLRIDNVTDVELRRTVLRDVAEMEGMVGDVLAYLRGGEGNGEPVILVAVTSLAQVIVDEFADRGFSVEERILDEVLIFARPVALKRAIRNLVENAVKYGTEPWIEITKTQNEVLISVGDRGPGLQPEDLAQAFEPFFRGNRARSAGEGSGLGLSTARAIAEAHNGYLTLVSTPGKGTVAMLRLPLPSSSTMIHE
ncbi:MAG: sensor histidine kinase [Gammaproteobacteria bacterium]